MCIKSSSTKYPDVLALTLVGTRLEETVSTAALETLTTLSKLHLGVWNADVSPASTPALGTSTSQHAICHITAESSTEACLCLLLI